MKRRVVTNKDNKRAIRWLQAAGQAKPPLTVVVDLSFARAVARECEVAPTVHAMALPQEGGNATRLISTALDIPCRVVVTAATMAACEKFLNETRERHQEEKLKQQQQQQQNQQQGKAQMQNQQQQKQKHQQQEQNQQQGNAQEQQQRPTFVQESISVAYSTKHFLKTCELWSPPPSLVEARGGPGNESRAVADVTLFGRPSLEPRANDTRPTPRATIVATHNPDTRAAVLKELGKYPSCGVAVAILRCLSRPYSLRLDTLEAEVASQQQKQQQQATSGQVGQSQQQQKPQQPLSQRAAADLRLIRQLQQQNLLTTKKARFVAKNIGGEASAAAITSTTAATKTSQDAAASSRINNTNSAAAAAAAVAQAAQILPQNKKVPPPKPSMKHIAKKKARAEIEQKANPLSRKKKMQRVPLRVKTDE